MILIHHLLVSQSERVIWLMEEMGLPYELKSYPRDPQTKQAHPIFQELNPGSGQAPVIQDGALTMAESAAIFTYILDTYGKGELRIAPGKSGYADFVYWFFFGPGTFSPMAISNLAASYLGDDPRAEMTRARFAKLLRFVDARLANNAFLAGSHFTIADMMIEFWFGTAFAFAVIGLEPYPNISAWLTRMRERQAYKRAMKRAGNV